MQCFITGCAGFVGSNLADLLLVAQHRVRGYDNFSTVGELFLLQAQKSPNVMLIRGDTLDTAFLTEAMHDTDVVFRFAANADMRFGIAYSRKDLEQNSLNL